MDRHTRFSSFRQKFCDAYNGVNKQELRFLLYDHLPVGVLGDENYSGMNLFTELNRRGHIEYNNVNIMSDIAADVTKNQCAKQSVIKYKEEVGKEYDDDSCELIDLYQLRPEGFTNKWDLVFYLEKELELNTQKKLTKFASVLNKHAQIVLLGDDGDDDDDQLPAGDQPEALESTERQPLTPLNIVGQAAALHERPPLTHLNIDLSTDDLLELLVDLSGWVKVKGNIYMLKLLLGHFKVISVGEIGKAKDPFDLFNLLIASGHISGKNIDLIIEVFSLCGWYDAADVIRKKIKDFKEIVKGMKITKFPQFRQNVIVFGRMLGLNKIKKICQLYRISVNQIVDQWDLLVELDGRDILESEIFIGKLKRNGMEKEANVLKKETDNVIPQSFIYIKDSTSNISRLYTCSLVKDVQVGISVVEKK
ncbi:uncharacterized protein [Antedon mediterranea]|uniref:uncharacterized protein n=1 Tax=Antedon mediterranea TaxID=105859 RepID=UPI003AF758BE